jgi:hypothetical protein
MANPTRVNLITNPGFEVGATTSWTKPAEASLYVNSTYKFSGTYGMRLEHNTAVSVYARPNNAEVTNAALVPGQIIHMTAKAKNISGKTAVVTLVPVVNSVANTTINSTAVATATLTNADWTEIKGTYTVPANGAWLVSFSIYSSITGYSNGDAIILDEVCLSIDNESVPDSYFDGSGGTLPAGYTVIGTAWNGTVNASTSTLTYYDDNYGPEYSVSTERMYRRLPEVYRHLDRQNAYQFKKYISAIADQLSDIDTLVARLEYVSPDKMAMRRLTGTKYNTYVRPAGIEDPAFGWSPIEETSDLFDGRTADEAWLPYIGQIIGANLTGMSTVAERRDAVINNYLGFRAGSVEALANATLSALTGTKYVRIYPHRDGLAGSTTHEGTMWDILIITKASETPGGASSIIDAITSKGAKPAGVVLHCITYSLIWSSLQTTFDTWTKIENTLTWENLESQNADDLPI